MEKYTTKTSRAHIKCTFAKMYPTPEDRDQNTNAIYVLQKDSARPTGYEAQVCPLIRTEDDPSKDSAEYTLTYEAKDYLTELFADYGWQYDRSGNVTETDAHKELMSVYSTLADTKPEDYYKFYSTDGMDKVRKWYAAMYRVSANDINPWKACSAFVAYMAGKSGYIKRHDRIRNTVDELQPYVVQDRTFFIRPAQWVVRDALSEDEEKEAQMREDIEEAQRRYEEEEKKAKQRNRLLLLAAGILTLIN